MHSMCVRCNPEAAEKAVSRTIVPSAWVLARAAECLAIFASLPASWTPEARDGVTLTTPTSDDVLLGRIGGASMPMRVGRVAAARGTVGDERHAIALIPNLARPPTWKVAHCHA